MSLYKNFRALIKKKAQQESEKINQNENNSRRRRSTDSHEPIGSTEGEQPGGEKAEGISTPTNTGNSGTSEPKSGLTGVSGGSNSIHGDSNSSGGSVAKPEFREAESVDSSLVGDRPSTIQRKNTNRSISGLEPRPLPENPADRNHRISNMELAPRGVNSRFSANIAAISLLKDLEEENRNPEPYEKEVLEQYSGWGALPNVFDNKTYNRVKERIDESEKWDRLSIYNMDYKSSWDKDKKWYANWGKKYETVKESLTEEEWEAARASTISAHYTSPEIIAGMWKGLEEMGFKGGSVLEPAGGVGHFIGLCPDDLERKCEFSGVELDNVSARIMQHLYPESRIENSPFEKSETRANSFDLAISNVPFSEVGPYAPHYPDLNLHNYFFAESLTKLKPGGVLAFVTTHNTMDSSAKQREYLEERSEFLGAMRLPNNAFKGAGTEVVADVIFLQKPINQSKNIERNAWSRTRSVEARNKEGEIEEHSINEYFVRNPEMVLGDNALVGTMYGGDSYTVEAIKNSNLSDMLEKGIKKLPQNIFGKERKERPKTEDVNFVDVVDDVPYSLLNSSRINGKVKDGHLVPYNDKLYAIKISKEKIEGEEREREKYSLEDASIKYPGLKLEKGLEYTELRDSYNELITLRRDRADQVSLDEGQENLKRKYDEWFSSYGSYVKGNNKVLLEEPSFYRLYGLEKVEGSGRNASVEPSALLSNKIKPIKSAPDKADSLVDAMRISLAYEGNVDDAFIAELVGSDVEEARQSLLDENLVFEDPLDGQLVTSEKYLSGNVKKKLEAALKSGKDDPRYSKNIERLTEIQPEEIPFESITVNFAGADWYGKDILDGFVRDTIGQRGNVDYIFTETSEFTDWKLEADRDFKSLPSNKSLGGGGLTAIRLIEQALNHKTPTVKYKDDEGKMIVNEKATKEARGALRNLMKNFDNYLKSGHIIEAEVDGETQEVTVDDLIKHRFNTQFNGWRESNYDGSHLEMPGMSEDVSLRPNQKDAIWRSVQDRKALIAHGVGGGKTFILAGVSQEWKRLGIAEKPLIVVQNATLEDFANAFRTMYPSSNVLVATKDQLVKDRRRQFLSQAANGDWDAIVMAQSTFQSLDDDPEWERNILGEQLNELEENIGARLESEGHSNEAEGKRNDLTVKQLVKARERLKNRLEKLSDREKEDTFTFQELGVDGLLIDEAHAYKKMPFFTQRSNVAGLDMSASQQAASVLSKVRYIQSTNNGGNVVTSTGTPITNTLTEAWNMTRLVSPDLLEEFGSKTFDQWADRFGATEASLEMNAAGKWQMRERFRKFVNGPELISMVRASWDVQMDLDKFVERPDIKTGSPQLMKVGKSEKMGEVMDDLLKTYEDWQSMEGKEKADWSHIPLVIAGTARAAAMDVRLIDPSLPEEEESKVNVMVDKAMELYEKTEEIKGTQLIFSDSYRPISTKSLQDFGSNSLTSTYSLDDDTEEEISFNLHEEIKSKFIAKGVPEKEIGIIGDAKNDKQREQIFQKVREGSIRFLVGGTHKMGVGVNVQQRLKALHHLDSPWTPADLEQRNGRAHRQGNQNKEIEILNYGVEGTPDAGRYQLIETKAKFTKQILTGDGRSRDFEDPGGIDIQSFAQFKADLSGDPQAMRLVELEAELRQMAEERETAIVARKSAENSIISTQSQIDKQNEGYERRSSLRADHIIPVPGKYDLERWRDQLVEINGKIDKETIREEFIENREKAGIKDKELGVSHVVGESGQMTLQIHSSKEQGKGEEKDRTWTYLTVQSDGIKGFFGDGKIVKNGKDVSGYIEDRVLRIEKLITQRDEKLSELESTLEKLEVRADLPIPHEERYSDLRKEYEELEKSLSEESQATEKEETLDEVDSITRIV